MKTPKLDLTQISPNVRAVYQDTMKTKGDFIKETSNVNPLAPLPQVDIELGCTQTITAELSELIDSLESLPPMARCDT